MGMLTAERDQADASDIWATARSGVSVVVQCDNCGCKDIVRKGRNYGTCGQCGETVAMPRAKVIGSCLRLDDDKLCMREITELNHNGGQCLRHRCVSWDEIQLLETQSDGPPVEPPSAGQAKLGAAK